jgi:3',5'-cyclic AMP phosphodiesterase CpdA
MRLVHLSDIHYLPRLAVPLHRFLNKRITGYVNLRFLRSFQHDSGMLDGIISAIQGARPDHVAITGDLTNLSLGVEFAELRGLLERLGLPPDRITVVPGNHDRYTRGADRMNRIRGYLEPYMRGDVDTGAVFPLVRLRDGVVLVGLDTARARLPLVAGGCVGRGQLARLVKALAHDSVRGSFPVIMLHHPPFRRSIHAAGPWLNGLTDYERLYMAIAGRSALILHGHLHRNVYLRHADGGDEWRVVGVASATRHGRIRPYLLSTFHVFDVDRSGVSRIERYVLDPDSGSFRVTEVGEDDFGVLVPGRGRTRLANHT